MDITNFIFLHLLVYITGYEFDPGIHYIGEMNCTGTMRLLSDQLTEGQLDWVPLEKQYDTVVIGNGDNARKYPICGGRQNEYRNALYESFPKERKAIDQYMKLLKVNIIFLIQFLSTGFVILHAASLTNKNLNRT